MNAVVLTDPDVFEAMADTPVLACDRTGGQVYLIYGRQAFDSTPYITGVPNRPAKFIRSLDGGATWSAPVTISGPAIMGTTMTVGPDGVVHVFWQDLQTSRILTRRSEDHGASFGPERVVSAFIGNPQTRAMGSNSVAYRFSPFYAFTNGAYTYDFPQVAIDRTNGPRRGTLYAVWAESADGADAPGSGVSMSEVEPNDTPAGANLVHIGDDFSSVGLSEVIEPNGSADYFAFDGPQGVTISLQMSHFHFPDRRSDFDRRIDGGRASILEPVPSPDQNCALAAATVFWDGTSPPLRFTLPVDGRYVIPSGASGGPDSQVRFWSLREFVVSPASVARDHRDIVITSSTDGGLTWGPKIRVNDDPPGADQMIPAVSVDAVGRVHVAWLDRRDPPVGKMTHTYWTYSVDGGHTFVQSRRLSPAPSGHCRFPSENTIGDLLALETFDGVTHVLWPQVAADGIPYIMGTRLTDLPTSIAVPRFEAEPDAQGILVRWQVGDATDITGFVVHRSHGAGEEYAPIATVPSHGEGGYEQLDRDVPQGESARYRLEVKRGGSSTWEGPIEATMGRQVTALAIERLGPNPFRDEAGFVLELPEDSPLKVQVFDVAGHLVREMATGGRALAGRQAFVWDGRDSRGRQVAPGVYHLRAEGARQVVTKRLVRLM